MGSNYGYLSGISIWKEEEKDSKDKTKTLNVLPLRGIGYFNEFVLLLSEVCAHIFF